MRGRVRERKDGEGGGEDREGIERSLTQDIEVYDTG